MKKIVTVNAGPRKNWNTDTLIKEAARGAADEGAEIVSFDLYDMKDVKGCLSCFACKRPESYGKCAIKDSIGEILDAVREADALILGSPNYLSDLTAGFHALYERLAFQCLTYEKEHPCANERLIPVLLITTSNCSEEMYAAIGYDKMLEAYQNTLNRFVGPTQLLICGNTLQVKDYSRYHWTMFNPEEKKKHREETFEDYKQKAYDLGKSLFL